MYSVTDERLPSCDTSQYQQGNGGHLQGDGQCLQDTQGLLSLSLLVYCLIPKLGGEWESHGTSGTDDLSSTTSVRRLR